MSKPTYEQLAELVESLARENAELKAHIARQDARIAELERQLSAKLAELVEAAVVGWFGQAGPEIGAHQVRA